MSQPQALATIKIGGAAKLVSAPPIEILLEPGNVILQATETGFVKSYSPAITSIILKEGAENLIYTQSQQRGTWYFQSISGSNIQTQSLVLPAAGVSTPIGAVSFTNFLPPAISASAFYSIKAYPYSLLPGHRTGSVDLFTTQSFTKNSDAIKARTVKLAVSTNTVTFDKEFIINIGSNVIKYPNFLSLPNANNIVVDADVGIVVTTTKPEKLTFNRLNNTNCGYGRLTNGPRSNGNDYKYIGEFNSYDECINSPNIDPKTKAIAYNNNISGVWSKTCYGIFDSNTKVADNNSTCGVRQ